MEQRGGEATMNWSEVALTELEKVPQNVRSMVKKSIEKHAGEKGLSEVTHELYLEARNKYLGKPEDSEKKSTKIAIVRCNIVSEVCPGVGCLRAFNDRRVQFEDYDSDTQLIGFFTCGGCSGRRVGRLVDKLLNYDLDTVHISSCMIGDEDGQPKCPFKARIKKDIEKRGVKVVEGTHH
jgi:predicted metal-binding protein